MWSDVPVAPHGEQVPALLEPDAIARLTGADPEPDKARTTRPASEWQGAQVVVRHLPGRAEHDTVEAASRGRDELLKCARES